MRLDEIEWLPYHDNVYTLTARLPKGVDIWQHIDGAHYWINSEGGLRNLFGRHVPPADPIEAQCFLYELLKGVNDAAS
jgi:hypothetical protein